MNLFHFSPKLLGNLHPKWSRGRLRVLWFCDVKRLSWAALHVAKRHQVAVGSLWVYCIDSARVLGLASRRKGVFTTSSPVEVRTIRSAECLFNMLRRLGVRPSARVLKALRFA